MEKKILLAIIAATLFTGTALAANPTGSVTGPASGDYWKDGAQTISFSAADTDSPPDFNASLYYSTSAGAKTTKIADLNLFESGICSSTDFTSGATCNYSWSLTGLGDGNYFIDIELKDLNKPDSATASSASFTIDNTEPTGTISAGASENNVTVTFSGADAHSGVTKYEVKADSESYIDKGESAGTHVFSDQSNGDHTYTLRITDRAGNQFETSTTANVDFTATTEPTGTPEISSDTHEDGEWTSNEDAEFEWTTVSGATVYRYALNEDDDYEIGNSDSSNGDSRSRTFDNLNDGERWFHVAGCNDDGCGPTAHYRARIDAGVPGAIPNIFGFAQSDGSIYLSWDEPVDNPSGNNSGIKEYAIYRFRSKQVGSRDFVPTDPGVMAFTGVTRTNYTDEAGLTMGLAYYYRIRAIDNAGNQGPLSGVRRVLLGPETCDVQIEFSVPENVKAGTLGITATISGGTMASADLKIKLPGRAFETIAIDKSGTLIEESFEVPSDTNGSGSLLLEGTSGLGAECQKLVELTFDPEKPEIELIEPEDNSLITGTEKITVSASDTGSGIKIVEAFVNSQNIGELEKTGENYELEWNSRTMPNGTYNLEVKAEDNAGNTGIVQAVVRVGNVEGEIISEETKTFENTDLDALLRKVGVREELLEEAQKLIAENSPKRTLVIARNGSVTSAVIVVTLKNSGEAKHMQLIEIIPKNIMESAREIESESGFSIIQDDPVIRFNLGEIATGEEARIAYTVASGLGSGEITELARNFAEFSTPPILLAESREEPVTTTPLSDLMFIVFIIIVLLIVAFAAIVFLGGGVFFAHRLLREKEGTPKSEGLHTVYKGADIGFPVAREEPKKPRFAYKEK